MNNLAIVAWCDGMFLWNPLAGDFLKGFVGSYLAVCFFSFLV